MKTDAFYTLIGDSLDFVFLIVPIILPFALLYGLIKLWIAYARANFLSKQEYVLVEIIPPQEVIKSPAAMELFLIALYQTGGEVTWIDRYIFGKVRAWFSLEIVSIEGSVHFYIWTRKILRDIIISQLYAQYPEAEVKEATDYTRGFNLDNYQMYAVEYELTKPDPYPIKTYVDFGMDKEIEEERVIDPLSQILEFFGSLGKGQNMWLQIFIRAHKKEDRDPNHWFKKTDLWTDVAKSEIKKIREESLIDVGDSKRPDKTKGQDAIIAALERSVSKLSFDTGMRSIYIAKKDAFTGINIGMMRNMFRVLLSNDLNGIKATRGTDFDYPWQDIGDIRLNYHKKEMLDAYKDRAYFWKYRFELFFYRKRPKFILNTEELATIFHLPGKSTQTPSFDKVKSKKAAPPSNLPV